MIHGLLHKHTVSSHGTAVLVHVAMALDENMDSVAAYATAQEGYHFND